MTGTERRTKDVYKRQALYTPIFAAARIVGWSAHRLEELKNVDKIIRPAYKPLAPHREYIKLDDR